MITALQCNREKLAQRVIERVTVIAVKLVELQDDIRELWAEFDRLAPGETIAGCATKKEFCERMLHRTPRAIRYMLAGGNQKQGEIISPLAGLLEVRNHLDQKIMEVLLQELIDEELDQINQRGVFTSRSGADDAAVQVGQPLQRLDKTLLEVGHPGRWSNSRKLEHARSRPRQVYRRAWRWA